MKDFFEGRLGSEEGGGGTAYAWPTLRPCQIQPAFASIRRLGRSAPWLRRAAPGAEELPSGELCHRQESCLGVVSCPRSRRRATVRLRRISFAPADCHPACCGR